MATERERILAGRLIQPLKDMYAESMKLSARWAAEFRGFWDLPESFEFEDAETPTVPVAHARRGRILPEEAVSDYLNRCARDAEARQAEESADGPAGSGAARRAPAAEGRSLEPETLAALYDERLSRREVRNIQSSFKNPDRFDQWLALLQQRVPYPEPIVLPAGEGLNIVRAENGEYATRCDCGHWFSEWRSNWKLDAVVHVRRTNESLREVYPERGHCDPDWMELREYHCPSCARQLEVEALPPGYPVVHEFLPDIEGFYAAWLGRELP
jgi:acetone carboxylase gamma subunit